MRRGLARGRLSCHVVLGHPNGVLKELSDNSAGIGFSLRRRRLNRLERLVTGSTSQAVGAAAHLSGLCGPSGWQPKAASGSVIVGIDASTVAPPVLEAAFVEAAWRELELQIVYAWESPMYSHAGWPTTRMHWRSGPGRPSDASPNASPKSPTAIPRSTRPVTFSGNSRPQRFSPSHPKRSCSFSGAAAAEPCPVSGR